MIGGQRFIDVFEQKDPDHYDRIARYPTPMAPGRVFVVPEWRRLFVAVPHRGIQSSEILASEAN